MLGLSPAFQQAQGLQISFHEELYRHHGRTKEHISSIPNLKVLRLLVVLVKKIHHSLPFLASQCGCVFELSLIEIIVIYVDRLFL